MAANGQDTGAIATFKWEVIPASAGRFADPDQANTTFEGIEAGEAVLRLTASDGFFQTVAECRTVVTSTSTTPPPPVTPPSGTPGVEVALNLSPAGLAVGIVVTLTCTSIGDVEVVAFTLGQVGGRPVVLSTVSSGVATFTPDEEGAFSFRCLGETADGEQSAPVDLAILVAAEPDDGGGRPGRGGR